MGDVRDHITVWVAREILPHEGLVRHWLRRRWRGAVDIDDVIQEAYCRIVALDCVDHIDNGRAYFFRTVQAVMVDSLRRARAANVNQMTEIDLSDVLDKGPSIEQIVEADQELERVGSLLSRLSWTCRRVIELRRIEGHSQKDTAALLGISESVVENHIVRGLRSVLAAMAAEDAPGDRKKPEAELIGRHNKNR